MSDEFQFPKANQRTAVVGKTGSGKTHFSTFVLSVADFDQKPWVIYDFKREEFFQQIPYLNEIGLNEIPEQPGLYITRPNPGEEELVEAQMWSMWKRENTGIFIDEAYMIDKYSKAYRALLTQGRSKNIPMINVTQRPVDVNRFVFSEADHHSVFFLNDERDHKIVSYFTPLDKPKRLPDKWSRWYDVNNDRLFTVQPAPGRDIILQRFEDRLRPPEPPQKRFF